MAQPTKEQIAIREMTREFVQKEVAPFAADWDRTATVPLDTVRRIGALGLFGGCIPTEWGGGGADFTSYVLVGTPEPSRRRRCRSCSPPGCASASARWRS